MNNLVATDGNVLNIIFFGYGESGSKCLEVLLSNPCVNICSIIGIEGDSFFDHLKNKTDNNQNRYNLVAYRKNETFNQEILSVNLDLGIVASFPYILPRSIFSTPRFGFINVHAALLPLYRGMHPLNWAIICDDKKIGVTIHKIDGCADSGDILRQTSFEITDSDDAKSILERIIKEGSVLLSRIIDDVVSMNKLPEGIAQDVSKVSFAPRRTPDDGKIDWRWPTRTIFNMIRALVDPYPGAFCVDKKNEKIKITRSIIFSQKGLVITKLGENQFIVSTGDGLIAIETEANLEIGDILR